MMRIPKPCEICGAQERWNSSTQRFENPVHDLSLHGLERPQFVRMSTEELFAIPNPDFSKLGNQREA